MDENNQFRRALKSPVMVGGLCLVAGVAVYANFINSDHPPAISLPLPMTPPGGLSASETPSTTQLAPHEDTAMIWIAHPDRDPFSPASRQDTKHSIRSGDPTPNRPKPAPIPQSSPISPLVLKAVAVEQEDKSAVINRTVVHEGERVEGFLVLSIEANGVWVEQQGMKQFLTFKERKISS